MVKCYRKTVTLSNIWVTSNDRLSDFYASSWQRGDSPLPLLIVRAILTAAAVAILVWSLIKGPNPYWLIYLTNWGLLFLTMMMLSGLLVSFVATCKTSYDTTELPWYVSMYWLLYNIGVSTAFLITALYWILLYDPDPPEREMGLDIATHGVNSCIALAELFASRTPVRMLHVFQPLGVGLWYAAFTGIYYAAGGKDGNGEPFIYDVLDWRQAQSAAAVAAAATAGLLLIYIVVWGVALCRDKISTALIRTISHDFPPVPDSRMHTRIV